MRRIALPPTLAYQRNAALYSFHDPTPSRPARRLKGCGCDKYQLSLDGMRATHDWFGIPLDFAPQVYLTMGCCDGNYPKRPPRHYAEVIYR